MRERGAKETAVSCRGALERDEGSDLSLRCPREQKFDSESVQGEQPVSVGKKTLLFARALATRSGGKGCSPAPDFWSSEILSSLGGGVFFSGERVGSGGVADKQDLTGIRVTVGRQPLQLQPRLLLKTFAEPRCSFVLDWATTARLEPDT